MRRRALLARASAAAVVACAPAAVATQSSSPSATATATRPPTPTPTSAPRADWAALRAAMRGTLLTPDTPAYEGARVLYNTRFDGIRPQALARCASASDVQACVRFARTSGTRLALRSGGHSYGGWSTGSGLVVDVGPLNAISVANGTATVGAGAQLVDVYDALAARGVGIAAGSCPTVGIAGLTLGGGIGVLTRAWGLTCDQLVSAQIVTADGALRDCDATTEPDLFWALRGAGAGSFGVVTSLTFATHAARDLALGFLSWPLSDAASAVAGWQRWMAAAPDALWSTLHIQGAGGMGAVTVHAVAPASGSEIAAELDRLVAAVGRAPSYRESGVRGYRDVMLLEAGCLGRAVSACHLRGTTPDGDLARETYAAKSIVADAPLGDRAIARLVDAVAQAGGGAAVLLDALGGAVARMAPDATAFPHRGAFAVLQLLSSWGEGADGAASLRWLRETHAATRPLIGPGAYANYADPELADWPTAYYGTNWARLRLVKRRYDPDRLFDFPQAVSLS